MIDFSQCSDEQLLRHMCSTNAVWVHNNGIGKGSGADKLENLIAAYHCFYGTGVFYQKIRAGDFTAIDLQDVAQKFRSAIKTAHAQHGKDHGVTGNAREEDGSKEVTIYKSMLLNNSNMLNSMLMELSTLPAGPVKRPPSSSRFSSFEEAFKKIKRTRVVRQEVFEFLHLPTAGGVRASWLF